MLWLLNFSKGLFPDGIKQLACLFLVDVSQNHRARLGSWFETINSFENSNHEEEQDRNVEIQLKWIRVVDPPAIDIILGNSPRFYQKGYHGAKKPVVELKETRKVLREILLYAQPAGIIHLAALRTKIILERKLIPTILAFVSMQILVKSDD